MNITQTFNKILQSYLHIHKNGFHTSHLNRIRRIYNNQQDSSSNMEHAFTNKELLNGSLSGTAFHDAKDDYFMSNPYDLAINITEPPVKKRPSKNPSNTYVIAFPDYQVISPDICTKMYKDIPEVKNIFDEASAILKWDMKQFLCKASRERKEKVNLLQPASLIVSLAYLERAKQVRPGLMESVSTCTYFGLGDLAGLTVTGVISFEHAIRLADIRGELIEQACKMNDGGLLLVKLRRASKLDLALGMALDISKTRGITNPVCTVAAYLTRNLKIIGGHRIALDVILKCAADFNFKVKRFMPMPASGAYYTDLMKPVVDDYRQALDMTPFEDACIPVYSSYITKRTQSNTLLKQSVVKQLYSPVKWEHVLNQIYRRTKGKEFPSTFICSPANIYSDCLETINLPAFMKLIQLDE